MSDPTRHSSPMDYLVTVALRDKASGKHWGHESVSQVAWSVVDAMVQGTIEVSARNSVQERDGEAIVVAATANHPGAEAIHALIVQAYLLARRVVDEVRQ